MRGHLTVLVIVAACLLGAKPATAQNCEAGYGPAKVIATNARLSFRQRAPGNDPELNYVKPRFRVDLGTSSIADVIPLPAWQRFFKSIVGTEANAVALVASVSNSGQIPLLIVDKNGNTGSSKLGLSRDAIPAFVVPSQKVSLAISLKMATSYDSNLGNALSVGLGIVGPLVGGVPVTLLSPAATASTKVFDGLINSTFTTMINQEWFYDLTIEDLKAYDCLRIAFYDGAISASGTQMVAQVTLELPTARTIIASPPPEKANIKWPANHLILGHELGGRTIKQILQQSNVGEVMGGLAQNKDANFYKEGCKTIRNAVNDLKLNTADTLAVYAAALATIKPTAAALKECPDADERKEMAAYGVATIATEQVWDTIYDPFLKDLASSAFRGSLPFEGLLSDDTMLVRQDVPLLKDFPVDQVGREHSAAELREIFKKGVITEFRNYEYRGSGVTIIKGLIVNGKKCQARLLLNAKVSDDGKISSFLREVRFIDVIY